LADSLSDIVTEKRKKIGADAPQRPLHARLIWTFQEQADGLTVTVHQELVRWSAHDSERKPDVVPKGAPFTCLSIEPVPVTWENRTKNVEDASIFFGRAGSKPVSVSGGGIMLEFPAIVANDAWEIRK
jgi:hypothetical protein